MRRNSVELWFWFEILNPASAAFYCSTKLSNFNHKYLNQGDEMKQNGTVVRLELVGEKRNA